MNVAELEGYALDAAVAEAEGHDWDMNLTLGGRTVLVAGMTRNYSPSTEWWYGGPIIQRERISVVGEWDHKWWRAGLNAEMGSCERLDYSMYGATPLIAAMRAYVASRQT